jgi:2,5-diamino-6-(ribosylamino)-4(3H)-pyrimidinone 5'-phosphate reductase
MAPEVITPAQSEAADDEHDDTMGDQSEAEEDDSKLDDAVEVENEQPTGAPKYSLFTNPPDLARVRQSLFTLEESFEMSPTDFDAYFPFVDNVWRKARGAEAPTDGSDTAEVYWCRLRKAPGAKPHIPRPTPEGKQPRKKRAREDKSCGMAMKVTYSDGPVKKVIIARAVEKGEEHTHDLEYMDGLKRNSAIMDVARRETTRAYLPTSVFWKMWQEPENMEAAGGKTMKVSDVRNVQYAWRQDNQTVPLKAHAGFNSQRAAQGSAAAKPKRYKSSPKQVTSNAAPEARSKPPPQPQPYVPPHASPQVRPPPQYVPQSLPPDTLQYPEHARHFLQSYLPDHAAIAARQRPHITLTWASSLDGRIAISPGHRTALSGPETKAMTHYLRSQHDAILVGVRTAIADDPALNCRLAGVGGYGGKGTEQQPRPIVVDPNARLLIRQDMNVLRVVADGRAKAPWIVVAPQANLHPMAVQTLKSHGGEFLMINDYSPQVGGFGWEGIFNVLYREGIRSIMIEGGGVILSDLLKPKHAHLIDSVIMTIAPTYLGKLGVQVAPDSCLDGRGGLLPTRLKDLRWQPMGDNDVVMCGRVKMEEGLPLQQLQYVSQPQPAPTLSPVPQQQQQSHSAAPLHHPPQQNGLGVRPGAGILQGIEEFSAAAGHVDTVNARKSDGPRSPAPKRARKQ